MDPQNGKFLFSVGVVFIVLGLLIRLFGLTPASAVADDLALGVSVLLVLTGFIVMRRNKDTK
ncbi:MAG: hypothetical protein K6T83_02905 [Alicyclobacillus sp.]|nr:hypothetical protein [Alicyclobacillus sp.]